jgi:hypothetical protein
MMSIKSKKIKLALLLCVFSAMLVPALTQAEEYETGSIASKRAAEQREAIAKRAARKHQEAEEKKAAEAQQLTPAEVQQPTEDKKEAPAAQ